MEFKTKILEFNKPTYSGKIYSKQVILEACENQKKLTTEWNPANLYSNNDNIYVDLGNVSHLYKLEYDDDYLYANIRTLSGQSSILEEIINSKYIEKFEFGIRGIGIINSDYVVESVRILDISLFLK